MPDSGRRSNAQHTCSTVTMHVSELSANHTQVTAFAEEQRTKSQAGPPGVTARIRFRVAAETLRKRVFRPDVTPAAVS